MLIIKSNKPLTESARINKAKKYINNNYGLLYENSPVRYKTDIGLNLPVAGRKPVSFLKTIKELRYALEENNMIDIINNNEDIDDNILLELEKLRDAIQVILNAF